MEVSLKGKVAVITGGTRGIGYSIAEVFGSEGASVAICGQNQQNVEKAVASLKEKGIAAYGKAFDIACEKSQLEFASEVDKEFGGIDIWINNAGSYPQDPITDAQLDDWKRLFDVNVNSVFIGAKVAKSYFIKRGGGVLVNACSFAAVIPSISSGPYAATKSAIHSMTRSLAAELAPLNIRVFDYVPGVIETDLTQPVITGNRKSVIDQIALHRIGNPKEIAYPLLFLVSEYASYITGVSIEISGGKFCVQNPSQGWE